MERITKIGLNKVYTRKEDGQVFKVLGWYGDNSLIAQPVKIVVRGLTPFGPDLSVRKIKGQSEQLKSFTMDNFSNEFRLVNEGDLKDA